VGDRRQRIENQCSQEKNITDKFAHIKLLVLGIGQSMRRDDAAGLEVIRLWQAKYANTAAQVQVELSELAELALLDQLEGMEAAILVDAIQSSAPIGTIIRIGPDDIASFTPESRSTHGWGVAETLVLGQRLYPSLAKCQVTLIGIVGKDFSMGTELSPELRAALAKTADIVEIEIQNVIKYKISGS
jgi:hydrogenase maturation protease